MRLKAKKLQSGEPISDKLKSEILKQTKNTLIDCQNQKKAFLKALENVEVNRITAQAIIDGLK